MIRVWLLLVVGTVLINGLDAQIFGRQLTTNNNCDCDAMTSCMDEEMKEIKGKMKQKVMRAVGRLVEEKSILPNCDSAADSNDDDVGYMCRNCRREYDDVKDILRNHRDAMRSCLRSKLGNNVDAELQKLKGSIESAMGNCDKPDFGSSQQTAKEGCKKGISAFCPNLPPFILSIAKNKMKQKESELPKKIKEKCMEGKGKGKGMGGLGGGQMRGQGGGGFGGRSFGGLARPPCEMPEMGDMDGTGGFMCMKEKIQKLKESLEKSDRTQKFRNLMNCMEAKKEEKCDQIAGKMASMMDNCIKRKGCDMTNMIGSKVSVMKSRADKMASCKAAVAQPMKRLMKTACECFAKSIGENEATCSCSEE